MTDLQVADVDMLHCAASGLLSIMMNLSAAVPVLLYQCANVQC